MAKRRGVAELQSRLALVEAEKGGAGRVEKTENPIVIATSSGIDFIRWRGDHRLKFLNEHISYS